MAAAGTQRLASATFFSIRLLKNDKMQNYM
jgi:hypothetical protein